MGAKVDGQGGFINLMKIKSSYYGQIREHLQQDITAALAEHPEFRDELFDKMHSFFSRYFSQNGSILFHETPFHNNVYEQVYTDQKDVILFWKTQMLYYVKTDTLFRDMPVEFDGKKFYFDASAIDCKKANEKRELVYTFRNVKDGVATFDVKYSERGRITKIKDIMRALADEPRYTERDVLRAFQIFSRQSECDFFINKNAGEFLKRQFKLWAYQYFWEGSDEWGPDRVHQLQILKSITFKVIDFIAQFENELAALWNKPKFVKNANYVVTVDRLNEGLVAKLQRHRGYSLQLSEWASLDIDKDSPHAPIDTKFFKDLEPEVLAQFEDLDQSLDGWLVKSENYQALHTLMPKFQERVRVIYIDPPFNLDSSDQFLYRTNYKDANWLTLLENRIALSTKWMGRNGSIFVRCNHDGNMLVRTLLDSHFGLDNFRNEIIVRRAEETKGDFAKQFAGIRTITVNYDNIYWFSKEPETRFGRFLKPTTEEQAKSHWHSFWKAEDRKSMRYNLLGFDLGQYDNGQWMWNQARAAKAVENYKRYLEVAKDTSESLDDYWDRTGRDLEFIKREGQGISSVKYWIPPRATVMADNNWLDIRGYANKWGFKTENSEGLLKRIVESLTDDGDLVLDYFAGSGTTMAVCQKMGRKWVGVEMGEHFYSVLLPRMKKVLAYDSSGISKELGGYSGGGFFKYFELEQYEEALDNCKYGDGDVLLRPDKSVYEQYVFLPDEKQLAAIEADTSSNRVGVTLGRLYDNIDVAETMSHLTGRWIKSIKASKVLFADGLEIDLDNLDHQLVRPLLWWERT